MIRLKKILAATDFSPRAGIAIERAARIARDWSAELSLLHVMGRLPLEAIRRILIEHPLAVEQRLVDAARNDLGWRPASMRGTALAPHFTSASAPRPTKSLPMRKARNAISS